MKTLSTRTINILKNFASINKNLLVREGNVIDTISESKSIVGHAKLEEDFDREFGIYDLSEFLGVYALFTDPVVEFGESSLTIRSGKSKVSYRYADKSILKILEKKVALPNKNVVSVTITNDDLAQIRKAASALNHAVASVRCDGKSIVLAVIDPKSASANSFSITLVEDYDGEEEFDLQFLISNIKVIPDDYDVMIAPAGISKWVGKSDNPLEYFIALEKTSTFKEA
jgi:hypothetical protein